MAEKVSFSELKTFLTATMRMSHIYQPLLIKTLLDAGGSATLRQLATLFLSQDESQIIYYEKRIKEMPVPVLSRHGILKRDGDLITLLTDKLDVKQKAELKMICEQKIQEYIVARGLSIWDYRLLDEAAVPDLLRYRILKEAKGRCSLCGATKDERPLDIDHIIPRSKGGKNTYENLQVLCSKCNRSKRNFDDVDFRGMVRESGQAGCLFCEMRISKELVLENDLAYVILDQFPVTGGHSLIIPKRHFADAFEMTATEHEAVWGLLQVRRRELLAMDETIRGFNIGINAGQAAGQTIFHCHIHLIPRRKGDVEDPKGGVRGVVPGRQKY